ncbi:MAG: methylated-DNA--[protein]-cysteine S-methyltransferase [Actinomycetia bacterium]|nr:methylated-DNA--[protein]-cysteine S-methyltransferase [Actinomycetes bacterium]
MSNSDPVLEGLRGLAVAMTDELRDSVLDGVGLADNHCVLDSEIGEVRVAFNRHGVSFLSDATDPEEFARRFADRLGGRPLGAEASPPKGLTAALRTGRGRAVDADLRTMSDFQRLVLQAARGIPVGEVRPYSWVAQRIGRPNAVRAVGSALGANPVPILIPCHRVIRSDGATGQYLFGSDTKDALLRDEGANLDEVRDLHARGYRYVGSDRTGIFCDPSCHSARRITESDRVLLRGQDAAESAGMRPCKHCQPVPAAA